MLTGLTRRRLLLLAPLAALVAAGAGVAAKMAEPPPADLDLSLSKATERSLYVVSLAADRSPVPVGAMHSWTVAVTTPDGRPAEAVAVAIGGGMPQHGHGLPTRPEATAKLGAGTRRIDGMKFNMSGWWTLTVSVDGPLGADTATFNLVL